ncbi:MAG: Mut7-C RNAse domain-containing protein [Halanaerobiales bacterium]
MKKIYFRFYAQLNDFFPAEKDGKIHVHYYQGRQSIKDRIETLGVPHTEVALILQGVEPVDFSYLVQGGERFAVFPVFKELRLPDNYRLRPPYPGKPRFILDSHLGKLARYLRMFGFDTLYRNDYQDKEIVDIALEEDRIILTRDHGLLMRKRVTYGYFIREDLPRRQLTALYNRYNLDRYDNSRGRCPVCNTLLQSVNKEEILDRLEPKTKKHYHKFYLCSSCDKIYWKGSHFEALEEYR